MYLFCGSNEQEITAWPWRIVFVSNFAGSVVSFTLAMSEVLSDLSTLHLTTSIVQAMWWISFSLCLFKSPAFVRDGPTHGQPKTKGEGSASNSSSSSSSRNAGASEVLSYSALLDAIATSTGDESRPQLCHSCHVVRPLRSKHCKIQRRCVHRVRASMIIIELSLCLVISWQSLVACTVIACKYISYDRSSCEWRGDLPYSSNNILDLRWTLDLEVRICIPSCHQQSLRSLLHEF